MKSTLVRMFQAVLEDSAKKGELQDLLIDTGREHERPTIHVGKDEYRLGLVDNKPMLSNVRTRDLTDPAIISNEITGISFLTNPVGIPGQNVDRQPGVPGQNADRQPGIPGQNANRQPGIPGQTSGKQKV